MTGADGIPSGAVVKLPHGRQIGVVAQHHRQAESFAPFLLEGDAVQCHQVRRLVEYAAFGVDGSGHRHAYAVGPDALHGQGFGKQCVGQGKVLTHVSAAGIRAAVAPQDFAIAVNQGGAAPGAPQSTASMAVVVG